MIITSFIISVGTGILAGIPLTLVTKPSVKRLLASLKASESVAVSVAQTVETSVVAAFNERLQHVEDNIVDSVHKMFGEDYSALESRIAALEQNTGKSVDLTVVQPYADFEKRLKQCERNISPFVR